MEYNRFENETDEEVIFRICSQKERIGTWQETADILNELLGNEYTESAYRKKYQAILKNLGLKGKSLLKKNKSCLMNALN